MIYRGVGHGSINSLTTGVDTGSAFTGGSGDDTFNAALSGSFATLNSLDQLNGGLGTDSINIELNGIAVVPTSLAAIELINVSSTTGTSILDLGNAPAVTAINSSASSGALTLNNIKSTAATVTIASSSAVHTIDYANSLVSGSTDTAHVSLSNFAATADGTQDLVIDSGIETLALDVSGTNSADSAFAGAMTVTGSGTLTLTAGTGGTASNLVLATSVDASAMTGALTLAMSNAAHTVTGGSGNDSLTGATATANTLTGNAGNDTLVGGSGNDVVSGGDGNDSLTAAAGNDSLDGGAGNDIFVMGANLTSSDSVVGGDGTDTVTATGTVDDAAFTNVTTVETLKSAGSTFVATLGALATAAGVTTVDLSNAGQDLVTFDTGYTGSATVNITGDSDGNTDQIVNTANATLNVLGNASDLDAGTVIT
ncbi:MAG: calcium-binding protein, partial [Betaproteobacteria bacterium]|nr:calcium-binding protein [Betaproteobacteria bacterium]